LLTALLALGCLCCYTGLAATAADAPTIVMADQAKYGPAPAPYPSGATMAVLSGDPAKAGSRYTVRLTPGSYASIPAGTPHYAVAKGETIVQVNGVGPASITLVKAP
jgi:hypothetical protein